MDDEKCFVFKSDEKKVGKRRIKSDESTPTKRRRIDAPTGLDASRQLREDIYRDLWNYQRDGIQSVLDEANSLTLNEISRFLDEQDLPNGSGTIPTAFVLAGPDTTSHASFFKQLSTRTNNSSSQILVTLDASECSNLKILLKTLIQKITSQDEDVIFDQHGARLFDYDLQIAHIWLQDKSKNVMAVAIENSESFQNHILVEMIDIFSSWSDRIPFVLLFGVATSVDVFQDRLPQSTLRSMQGQSFNAVQSQELLERIFCSTIVGSSIPSRIGPNLARAILKRPKEHIQSPNEFIDAFQYAYMCHFYSNPLSVFLKEDLELSEITPEHLEVIRHTPSFRRLVERFLENEDEAEMSEKLLDSDQDLLNMIVQEVRNSQTELDRMTIATQLLERARNEIPGITPQPLSHLYLLALQGDLLESPLFREFMLTLKKTPSDMLRRLLPTLSPFLDDDDRVQLDSISNELEDVLNSIQNQNQSIKSKHDVRNITMRTTVVAQKVELSTHTASISEEEKKYSVVLDQFIEWMENYMEDNIVSVNEIMFPEVIVYDGLYADSMVFMPRARSAIERALSAPQDYLNCECCKETEEGTILSTQPATALLYQLYQESGTTINIHDLWNAFSGVLGTEHDEQHSMFLFQRSLAELRYFGMFRSTKKKADHVIRTSWRGL